MQLARMKAPAAFAAADASASAALPARTGLAVTHGISYFIRLEERLDVPIMSQHD